MEQKLRRIDWFQFEKIVAALYRKQGYVVTRRGGANADGGIDLILEKAGEQVGVQCKQWKTWKVRVRPVREFVGALTVARLAEGIFVALGPYTDDARDLANRQGIELVQEHQIVSMLQGSDARFDPAIIELLDDTRKFCPKCEAEMVLRTAAKGTNVGKTFWGCSRYPRCHYVLHTGDKELT